MKIINHDANGNLIQDLSTIKISESLAAEIAKVVKNAKRKEKKK